MKCISLRYSKCLRLDYPIFCFIIYLPLIMSSQIKIESDKEKQEIIEYLEHGRYPTGITANMKRDFDSNHTALRLLLDSFYEEGRFTVLNLLQNNLPVIKNSSDASDIRTVFKGRLKKIDSWQDFKIFLNFLLVLFLFLI